MNENQLVSASADGSIKLWDVMTSKSGIGSFCCVEAQANLICSVIRPQVMIIL